MKQEIMRIKEQLEQRVEEWLWPENVTREYVDYEITKEIKEKLKYMLNWMKETFKKKQANPDLKTKRLLERGVKVKGLWRMVFGFRETIKQLKLENLYFVVVAKNVMKVEGEEGTDEALLEILKLAWD